MTEQQLMPTQAPEAPNLDDFLLKPGQTPEGAQSQPVVPHASEAHPDYGNFNARTEAGRQMGIAAADRVIRDDAGLRPRMHDLR